MRILVTIVLPLLLPTLIFWGYYVLLKREQKFGRDRMVANAPWLILGGVVLMVASLAFFSQEGREGPGQTYQPARMVDGELVGPEYTEGTAPPPVPKAPEPATPY